MARKKKRRSAQFKESSRVIDIEDARRERQERRKAEQAKQAEDDAVMSERKLKRKRALRKKQSRRRIVIGIVCAFLLVLLVHSAHNIVSLQLEKKEALNKQEQLQEEKKELEQSISEDDLEKIEDQAREKLKLIKPGETIYIPEEEAE